MAFAGRPSYYYRGKLVKQQQQKDSKIRKTNYRKKKRLLQLKQQNK
jgi:hypothetical protein